jgi:sec-independent protein translocase protein TatA
MLPFNFGPVELILILVIVAMLFGVGKLPEVFGVSWQGHQGIPQGVGD